MKTMDYKEFTKLKSNDPTENIFPKGTSDSEAMNVLIEGVLGEDWYVVDPVGPTQVTTIAVAEILYRYESFKKERYILFALGLFMGILFSILCMMLM